MAVAILFGEQESAEQVNCVVSSMHQASPLYPQLLTYRRGAANRRFGANSRHSVGDVIALKGGPK
jgi:hypothetical protein